MLKNIYQKVEILGRLSRRLGNNEPTNYYEDNQSREYYPEEVDNTQYQQPSDAQYQGQEMSPEEYASLQEYYRNLQQQRMQLQSQKRQQLPQQIPQQYDESYEYNEHGETKNPNIIAAEIENKPAPKGTAWMNIGGRPIDLHELEDYLVWKTSPFVMKTLMRYHNAKTMEDIKNYSRGRTSNINSRFFIMLLLCIGIAMLGIVMIFFMPQIMEFFKGGI